MDKITVETTPAGVPLRFGHNGRTWRIAAEPIRWYERLAWWNEFARLPRTNAPRIDVEVWRVQARLGQRGELVTVDLIRDQHRTAWNLRPYEPPNSLRAAS